MGCDICGDESTARHRGRWWSPDDGWRWASLCDDCADRYGPGKVQPSPEDYAWRSREDLDCDTYLHDTQ